MKAVTILFGHAEIDATWETGKKLMVSPKQFKQQLLEFDISSITNKMLKSVNKMTKSEEFASTKSPKAAGILTQWVLVVFWSVGKIIEQH